ncbi:rho GTPase-activating protein gacK-like [Impatiens glandulifera]|uniref:rho GTPase-activating protein gacK-like n=1 Tax=Impatiens glandulifera TaxID=253017 RepID=UPI001FB19364|nr:rho GTPase-activating protein gacK-like [Impatiens glandulifera]
MGKSEQQLPLQSHQGTGSGNASNSFFFTDDDRCIFGCSTISKVFTFKCIFVLFFGMAVLISAIFLLIPLRSKYCGFDAKDSTKLRATVQAYFELDNPVASIIQHINQLEYEIFNEIQDPFTKVAVLSMHEGIEINKTNVVFGFLPNPPEVSINNVSLSLLKQTVLDLFMGEYNLTISKSFGQPSSFEILKFPLGITVDLNQYPHFGKLPQILFNFTLINSIDEIKENIDELKKQLTKTLHLMQYENVYVEVTNKIGSTIDPPVKIQAYITSDFGSLSPQRLNQLAQTIKGSPISKNLGLNNTVFGKVKEISLASLLNHSTHSMPPSHSPSPSPSNGPNPSSRPHFHRNHHHHNHLSPSNNNHHHNHLSPSNNNHHNHLPPSNNNHHVHRVSRPPSPAPVSNCHHHSFPSPPPARSHNSFAISPAPSKDLRVKNPPSPSYSQPSESPRISPKHPPLPVSTYSSSPSQNSPVSAPVAASPLSSFAIRPNCGEILLFALLLTFILL